MSMTSPMTITTVTDLDTAMLLVPASRSYCPAKDLPRRDQQSRTDPRAFSRSDTDAAGGVPHTPLRS